MALEKWAKTIFLSDIDGNELIVTSHSDAIIFEDKVSGRIFRVDGGDFQIFIDLISDQNG